MRFLVFPTLILTGTIAWALTQSNIAELFYWTIAVPLTAYVRDENLALSPNRGQIVGILPLALSLLFAWFIKGKKALLLISFFLAGALGAYPRWAIFHLLPSLAFAALSFGYCVEFAKNEKRVSSRTLATVVAGVIILLSARQFYYFWRVQNPNVDVVDPRERETLAAQVRDVVGGNDVFDMEYGYAVYFLLKKTPPVLPWPVLSLPINKSQYQEEIAQKLERRKIPYVVFWQMPRDPTKGAVSLTDDFHHYLLTRYEKVDLGSGDVSLFRRRDDL